MKKTRLVPWNYFHRLIFYLVNFIAQIFNGWFLHLAQHSKYQISLNGFFWTFLAYYQVNKTSITANNRQSKAVEIYKWNRTKTKKNRAD